MSVQCQSKNSIVFFISYNLAQFIAYLGCFNGPKGPKTVKLLYIYMGVWGINIAIESIPFLAPQTTMRVFKASKNSLKCKILAVLEHPYTCVNRTH